MVEVLAKVQNNENLTDEEKIEKKEDKDKNIRTI